MERNEDRMTNYEELIRPKHIIEHMRDSIVIIGTEGKFKYVSPQLSNLLGGVKVEKGDNIFNIVHPSLIPFWKNEFQKAIEKEHLNKKQKIETRLIHKEKKFIYVECLASNYFDKEGKLIGYIVSIRDVTERKKIKERLTKEKEKYKLLTENQKDVTMSISLEGTLLYCSPAVKEFGGYDPEQEIGEPIEKYIASKSDLTKILNIIEEAIKDKQHRVIELYYQPKKGKPFPIEVTASPVMVNGQVKKFHCIMRDISEQKQAEQKLMESKKELQELNRKLEEKVKKRTKKLEESKKNLEEKNLRLKKLDEIKNNFISMTAHELKTPLTSIYGYIDYILLAYRDKIDQSIIDDLHIAQRNVKRLKKPINQLLDVMKIEESTIKLNKTKTNFKQVLNACINELQILITQKDQELTLQLEENLTLNIDSERIFQVCSNLLSNSIKFTPKGGHIIISAKKEEDKFIFKIKDNGRGLSETEKRFIFKKLEKLGLNIDSYPRGKGTGLSLFISKGIIEAHGGRLWAESAGKEKGSTFIFSLPLKNSGKTRRNSS
ncbi:MAG: PAS domain-containing sensor histidine kinase [Promethearchaeia archaeon]